MFQVVDAIRRFIDVKSYADRKRKWPCEVMDTLTELGLGVYATMNICEGQAICLYEGRLKDYATNAEW